MSASAASAQIETPRRLKVCFVSLNEPEEMDVFRASLDPARFELFDVRQAAQAGHMSSLGVPDAVGHSWLTDACTPEASCDVVVYTAEFAGRFFGKRGSLSLQEMEEASCQKRCAGLFRKPKEVFLLACNTLATKDEDSRTPEEYLGVLLDHGFDHASAERVVQLRYGPLGPSFRESLRRIFAGVPRIYGFSSVAPRGAYTAPMLSRYLRDQGDYANALLHNASTTERNGALLSSFKKTSLTQASGLMPNERGAADRQSICDMYDESLSVAERLKISYGLLSRPDALTFVPTLQVFLSRHPPEKATPHEKSILAEIQNLDSARDAVMQLVRQLNVSALKLELAHFAVLIGWLHPSEFHRMAVDGATELLREPLTSEVVDIMCEITKHEPLHGDFRANDFPPILFSDPEGLRLISCIAPSDPRAISRVLPALDSPLPPAREWAAHTLTQLLPRDQPTLERLVPYLHDSAPEVSTRIRWIFQAQQSLPKGVEQTVRKIDPGALPPRRVDRVASSSGFGFLFFK